jgi:hypothetical protein
MWLLYLNDMRSAHIEHLSPAGWAHTKEALAESLAAEKVPSYWDGRWGKTFRQGGPLEWFNPPTGDDREYYIEVPPTIVLAGCVEYRDPRPVCPELRADMSAACPTG